MAEAANWELQREIGHRRLVQESLAHQSAILTSVNHRGDGVVVADEHGGLVLSNPVAEGIIGLDLSEASPA